MKIVLFCHSLLSDWNHGNAHFLRGVVTELQARGHSVEVFESHDAWSVTNLAADYGEEALQWVREAYPRLPITRYDLATLDLDQALDGASLVIVHEWSPHELVARIGRHRARGGPFVLLFHDTHHRSVTEETEVSGYDLSSYDGVLAFGEVIRERYLARGWARRAWTWHEAADVRVFTPESATSTQSARELDLIWIGNWGDGERSQALREYLIAPARDMGLRARVHGVRYPPEARHELRRAGVQYAGWLPNFRAPQAFARAGFTVHIPRRPYVEALPGIPTIRVFEALGCGIPLVCCWWDDCEQLFRAGVDYLVAHTPAEMRRAYRALLNDPDLVESLIRSGLQTIRGRHTCGHRASELLAIATSLGAASAERAVAS